MNWTKKSLKIVLFLMLVPVSSHLAQNAITIKGSDTMVLLGQRWAEVYMKKNPELANPGDRRRFRHGYRSPDQRDH